MVEEQEQEQQEQQEEEQEQDQEEEEAAAGTWSVSSRRKSDLSWVLWRQRASTSRSTTTRQAGACPSCTRNACVNSPMSMLPFWREKRDDG